MSYRPRRTTDADAPEYVLACYDNGGKTADRYTVLIGGTLTEPTVAAARRVEFLGMSDAPTHPQGFSQWGECQAFDRKVHGRHIRWADFPAHIRSHIVARCTSF